MVVAGVDVEASDVIDEIVELLHLFKFCRREAKLRISVRGHYFVIPARDQPVPRVTREGEFEIPLVEPRTVKYIIRVVRIKFDART